LENKKSGISFKNIPKKEQNKYKGSLLKCKIKTKVIYFLFVFLLKNNKRNVTKNEIAKTINNNRKKRVAILKESLVNQNK
jgi:hypothetical protein